MGVDLETFHHVIYIKAQRDVRLVAVDYGQVGFTDLSCEKESINQGAKNGVKVS